MGNSEKPGALSLCRNASERTDTGTAVRDRSAQVHFGTGRFLERFYSGSRRRSQNEGRKEAWALFLEEAERKTAISESDLQTIKEMDMAIMNNPTTKALLKTGIHETPIEWKDGQTGEECKCRPDCITDYKGRRYIVDYKTTTSCEDGAFERSCRKYGYKLQAGMYTEGVFNKLLNGDLGFAFVAQERRRLMRFGFTSVTTVLLRKARICSGN